MAPLVGWQYPIHWHLVGDGKVVTYWENVMPTPPGDDRRHSFFGISVLTYGGDGKWSRQEDVYNGKEMEAAMQTWLEAGGTLGTRAASQPMLLEGRTVIVTGVGGGLGRECVTSALREGANVVMAARTQAMLDATCAELDP